jgi:hypothetical protein
MNQTGITCGFYRKGCAGLKGCRPAGYPSRYVLNLCYEINKKAKRRKTSMVNRFLV